MTDYTTKIAELESKAAELEALIAQSGENAMGIWVNALRVTKKEIASLYSERFFGKDEYRKIKAAR